MSTAHKGAIHFQFADKYPGDVTGWRDAEAPVWPADDERRTTGRLRACDYCGSMHPADVAAAIVAGATGEFADWKYGWPHKTYFDGIPNPHVGMIESRAGNSHPPQAEIDAGKWIRVRIGFNSTTGEPMYSYRDAGKPAAPTTHGKFYSIHLQDATAEERDIIQQHLGLVFTFEDGRVRWRKWTPSDLKLGGASCTSDD